MAMQREIEVIGDWTNLDTLLAFAIAAGDEMPLCDEQRYYLHLAVEEVATNIIKYGYPDGDRGVIHLACICDDAATTLVIVIRDKGVPYDPNDCPPPDLSSNVQMRQVGGLGVFLIRELADDLTYHHDEESGWNELRLRKHRADTADGTA